MTTPWRSGRERLGQADAKRASSSMGIPDPGPGRHLADRFWMGQSWSLDAVVYIEVPEDELIKRALARQRADDQEEVIRQRQRGLSTADPAADRYYEAQDLLCADRRSSDHRRGGRESGFGLEVSPLMVLKTQGEID